MSESLVIRNIGQLVTADKQLPSPGVVEHGLLAATDGVISYAGPEAEFRDKSRNATEIDAHGAAVIPGFVDAHTHLVWLGDRSNDYLDRARGVSYEDISTRGGGIASTVRYTAEGDVSELARAALQRATTMLRHGTTTVEIKSGYGGTVAAEEKILRAASHLRNRSDCPDIFTTYMPLHAKPGSDRKEFVHEVVTSMPQFRELAQYVDCFCEGEAWTVEECEAVLTAGKNAGLKPKIHAEQRSHQGGAALAARIGAVSADHLEFASDEDFKLLVAAAVVGVFLPGASLVLGGATPSAKRAVAAGMQIAIATDCNPGTCYSESMPLMISLAVHLAGLTPDQALLAATRGGAAALGLSDRGALQPGMRCDAVILDSTNWVDVAYHLGGDIVHTVIKQGRIATPANP